MCHIPGPTAARAAGVAALLLAVVPGASPGAGAQPIAFTGSRTATDIPPGAPDPARCGGPPNVLIGGVAGVGASNLGAFTTEESNCLNPALGLLTDGRWRFAFADASTLFGTATGTVRLPPVGGEAPVALLFTVTGGTARFANASGTLTVGGRIRFNPGGTTTSTVDVAGTVNTVPEPGAVLLTATGLAGVAAAGRRRRGGGAGRSGL